jgi:hypothetical protein
MQKRSHSRTCLYVSARESLARESKGNAMDPNAAHEALTESAEKIMELAESAAPAAAFQDVAIRMAEQYQALDNWLRRQGFKPAVWE